LPGMKGYVSTGAKNEAAARAVLKEILQKRQLTMEGQRTLREYIEPFYDYDRCPHIQRIGQGNITRKSARIIRSYIKNHVLTDPIADMPLCDIKTRDITAFRARLQKKTAMAVHGKKSESDDPTNGGESRPLSKNTIDKIMNSLKTVFGEAVINHDIEYNPCVGIVRLGSGYDNPRGAFGVEELETLFNPANWSNNEAWYCFQLVAVTGMRCGEILALQWGCISEEEIAIVNAWKDTHEQGEPKGEKPRIIPASRIAWRVVEDYRATRTSMCSDDDLLFCNPVSGERRGTAWWRKNFLGAMHKARLSLFDSDGHKRTPHSLRHTLNTILLADGVSPILVREYLGWSEDSHKLTRVQRGYTHFSVTDMKGLVDTIDRVFEPIIKKDAEK